MLLLMNMINKNWAVYENLCETASTDDTNIPTIFSPYSSTSLSGNYIDSESSYVWKLCRSSATSKRILGMVRIGGGVLLLSYLEFVWTVEFWWKFIKQVRIRLITSLLLGYAFFLESHGPSCSFENAEWGITSLSGSPFHRYSANINIIHVTLAFPLFRCTKNRHETLYAGHNVPSSRIIWYSGYQQSMDFTREITIMQFYVDAWGER
jgi:hypothetical protein